MSMASVYSILITTYECHGQGPEMTRRNLESIVRQTYRPIQVVVSDHSKNDEIEEVVKSIDMKGVELIYTRYTENYGNPVWNWKNALQYATGDLIRYFAMDDYFGDEDVLEQTVEYINTFKEKQWFVSAHILQPSNTLYLPKWNNFILYENTFSGPSGITIRKSLRDIQMNPKFIMHLDTEWYYRLSLKAGNPVIVPIPDWNNVVHKYQLSTSVCDKKLVELERIELYKMYGNLGYNTILDLFEAENKKLSNY